MVTGSAGFIGFHLSRKLLCDGHEVMGYDGVTPYYDVELKRRRIEILEVFQNYTFIEAMLEDMDALNDAAAGFAPDAIVHLAAQAGVRYSLENPKAYVDSNLVGTYNLLEVAKEIAPRHLLIASTSSVYGGNQKMPFNESDRTDFPVSLYAATKKSGEAMSHSYSHLFKVPTTCFRFFTVYGPWGRPDMALFKFVERILEGRPIEVYGEGNMRRDFTYIDDIVQGIYGLIPCAPEEGKPIDAVGVVDSLSSVAPWRAVNIAGGQPVGLLEFIRTIETSLEREADKVLLPMQKGDVRETYADAALLKALTDYEPSTPIEFGVGAFVDWYQEYRQTR